MPDDLGNEARMFFELASGLRAARRQTAVDTTDEIGALVDELECMRLWSTWPLLCARIDDLLAAPAVEAAPAVSAG